MSNLEYSHAYLTERHFFPSSPVSLPATVAGVMRMLKRFVLVLVFMGAGNCSVHAQDRPLPAPSAELKALEWMLGSWTHEAEGVVLKIDCTKSDGGYFLERTFQLKLGREANLTRKQFIGWDPVAKKIRSWGFGSDGTVETGVWSKEGNTFEVERTITYADGKQGTAINLITRIGEDAFLFKSVERHYGKQLLPDIIGLEVERSK